MAKADDTILDWIWLREARDHAFKALGSMPLAEKRLRQWLAAGEVPWDCTSFEAPTAEDIAKAKQGLEETGAAALGVPIRLYDKGDPGFWNSTFLRVDWQNSSACAQEFVGDTLAQGIKVPMTTLRARLPGQPREEAPRQVKPAERKKEPNAWLAWARTEYPRRRDELKTVSYIRRLHREMKKADNVTGIWEYENFRRRYYEAVKADQQAVQKKHKSPRTV